jgi:hypothetical protein
MYEYLFSVDINCIPTECKALLVTNTIDPDDWEVEDFFFLEEYDVLGEHWVLVDKNHEFYDRIKEKFESLDEWNIDYEWDHYRE